MEALLIDGWKLEEDDSLANILTAIGSHGH